MSSHKDHSGVQEKACAALYNLAFNNDGVYIFVFHLGRLVCSFLLSSSCVIYLSLSLWSMHNPHYFNFSLNHAMLVSLSVANRVKIASLGGIEAVIKAMSTHKDRSWVQENACAALWNLAANNDGNCFSFSLCRRLDIFLSSFFLLCCLSEA